MRNASSESASIRICENATFTIMALVENNIDPVKASKNPATEIEMPECCFIFIEKTPDLPGYNELYLKLFTHLH